MSDTTTIPIGTAIATKNEVVVVDDDPLLQAALLEAESLMESLVMSGDDDVDVDVVAVPTATGSFSIDDDDDDDNNLHPLHEAFLQAPITATTITNQNITTTTNTTTTPVVVSTCAMSTHHHPTTSERNFVGSVPPPHNNNNNSNNFSFVQQQQHSSMTPMFGSNDNHHNNNNNNNTVLPNFGLSSSSSSTSTTPVSLDNFKASTSRFASNLANMAQRAANQVSTAVGTPTAAAAAANAVVGGFMPLPTQSQSQSQPILSNPMSVQQHSFINSYQSPTNAAVGTSTNTNTTSTNTNHNNYQSLPELDAEQKSILVHSHVGELIPGERIIMFLPNVQHVSDSTGFQYNDGGSTTSSTTGSTTSSSLWCCAMTYYRFILFSTHPIQGPMKPNEWNASCWPSNPQSVLQIPLSNIDKVEKSVFTVTTTPTATSGFGSMTIGTSNSTTTNATAATTMMMMATPLTGTMTNHHHNYNNNNNTLSTTTIMGLILHDKLNGRQIRFTTQSYPDTNRAYEALHTYSFPGRRNLGYLFAFESKREQVMASIETDTATGTKRVSLPPNRKRFDAEQEFQRQFTNNGKPMDLGPWTIWNITNASYHLCHSYPSIIVGPISLDERLNPDKSRIISHCAAFRSEQRLPALTWCGMAGSSIWRCSQPKVGLQGNRSTADEQYLKHIMECAASARSMSLMNDVGSTSSSSVPQHHQQQQQHYLPPRSVLVQLTGTPDLTNWMPNNVGLKILDLRPRSSAMANRTGGYGYENTSHYIGCSLQFCNIGNIHAVRDSYQKLSQICLSTMSSDLQFASHVEDTKWLSHIRVIWAAAWEAAYWVQIHKLPVLVHCSHGWDRTSQVVSLSQLLLDPYYRTMSGFSCLVEKDFMSFGHPFHLRCGHGEGRDGASNHASSANGGNGPTIDEGQISPIFLQFLDCVYQVVRLYPEAFEFNTKYLLLLSEHIYSGRFGNFLCDSERERETVAGIRQRTHSVWDYLDEQRSDVVNVQYCPKTCGAGVLLMPMPTLLRNITLWTDRHCMYSPKPTMRWLTTDVHRPIHALNHDQPSDLITEQETYQLLYALPTQQKTEKLPQDIKMEEAAAIEQSENPSHESTSTSNNEASTV